MFVRPSSLLPSVDVRAGQTSRVSLCLRTGNFPVPHGVSGLSGSYPTWQLYKSLTCHLMVHSLTHWKRNWGGRTKMDKLAVINCECEYSELVAKRHGTRWWQKPHVTRLGVLGLVSGDFLVRRLLNKLLRQMKTVQWGKKYIWLISICTSVPHGATWVTTLNMQKTEGMARLAVGRNCKADEFNTSWA